LLFFRKEFRRFSQLFLKVHGILYVYNGLFGFLVGSTVQRKSGHSYLIVNSLGKLERKSQKKNKANSLILKIHFDNKNYIR
jgi:hypothetical protein